MRRLAPLLAFVWAAGFMTLHGYQNRPPTAEEANIATHLALGHGFRSPMDPSPGAPLSAWSPPVYPFVIAAVYALFGVASPAAVTALMLLNAFCFALIVAGTIGLAVEVFGSCTPGLLAGAFLSIHPLFLFYMGDFWDGFVSLALFVWVTLAAVRLGRLARSGVTPSLVDACVLGAGLGVLVLTNASYALVCPLLLWIACPRTLASRWRPAVLASATLLVAVTPWTVRNYEAFGRVIPVRTGDGIQFWIGNAPISEGWLSGKAFGVHPYVNRLERQSLLELGEPAYNDRVFRRFRNALNEHPLAYVVNCARRSLYLLVGSPTDRQHYPLLFRWQWRGVYWDNLLLNALVSVLGGAGMIAMRRLGDRSWVLPMLAIAVSLPFVATAVIDRYSLPLRWVLLMYAAALVWKSIRHLTGNSLRITSESLERNAV